MRDELPARVPGQEVEQTQAHGGELEVVEHDDAALAQPPGAVEPVDDRSREGMRAVDEDQIELGRLERGQDGVGGPDLEFQPADVDVTLARPGQEDVGLLLGIDAARVLGPPQGEERGGDAAAGLERTGSRLDVARQEVVAIELGGPDLLGTGDGSVDRRGVGGDGRHLLAAAARVAHEPGFSPIPPLAILIPTFSRAHYLEQLIRWVAAEPVVRERRLPVVVSDNHSTDDTVATVRALMREFPELDLRLYAQPESLGPIGNLAWLVEHAPPAEYLWWLGDDDLPTEGTVGAALDAIAAHAPALVHLPCEWREPDGRLSGASPCPEELERYATGRELLLTYYCLHFISASIVRRAELQEALHLAPTRNLWAPHIWFGVAARHAACVVLPRVGVVGGLDSTWLPQRVPLLTRGVVESFDAGLHLAVGEEDFARMLDIRYEPAQGNDEYWMAAPIEDLTGALERFPASRQLRRLALERTL